MSSWPLWRLLVSVEGWLLTVTALHLYRPMHEAVVVPLLIAIVPGAALVVIRSLARAATDQPAIDPRPAGVLELAIAVVCIGAAGWWVAHGTLQARDDLRRIDAMLGQATIIVDVSLTGLSMVACLAVLTLDWFLATAHQQFRDTMHWLRRAHIAVTVVHVLALFGSAWAFTHASAMSGDNAVAFQRARTALHLYEYAKATIFPVQAVFAALAVLVVALDSRSD